MFPSNLLITYLCISKFSRVSTKLTENFIIIRGEDTSAQVESVTSVAATKGLRANCNYLHFIRGASRVCDPGVLDPKKGLTHPDVHVGDLHERREIYGSRQSGDRRLESANKLRATAGRRHLRVSG